MKRFLLVGLLAGIGCKRVSFELDGAPCGEGCLQGYECRPDTGTCAPTLQRGCGGGAVCWRDVATGSACAVEGSYLPCGPDDRCDTGCRTCQGGMWSSCETAACDLGTLRACGACSDNCELLVYNAAPFCNTTGAANVCDYALCEPGHADADANHRNGCECQLGGSEICNGEDDNCDGQIDDVAADADCAAQFPEAAATVVRWICDRGCVIAECAPNQVDADPEVPGCETFCTPTNGGIESCDGVDNDCDGRMDDVASLDAECASSFGAGAAHVAAWGCNGQCVIAACDAGWTNADADTATGCETPCTPSPSGIELCNGADDDCDGVTDDVPDLTAECELEHGSGEAVLAWACVGGACAVDRCQSNFHDADGAAANGCEYPCTRRGVEHCNGLDDDCDGSTDAADSDLDSVSEVSADCEALYAPIAPSTDNHVAGWECLAADCHVTACDPGFWDYDGLPRGGCEYACTPEGGEICDAVDRDNDCDGTSDVGQGLPGCTLFYRDADGDGYGQPGDAQCLCDPAPPYRSTLPEDCFDARFDAAPTCTRYYGDADGDGAGDRAVELCACSQPAGYVTRDDDCDDSPAGCGALCSPILGAEVCSDGFDNDCAGGPDNGCNVLNRANHNLVNDDVSCLALDASNNLWAAGNGTGELSYMTPVTFNGSRQFTTVPGLRAARVVGCGVDGAGNGWFGYDQTDCDNPLVECGPTRVLADRSASRHFPTDYMSTATNAATAFAFDPETGDMYVGTQDDYGIYKVERDVLECDISVGNTNLTPYAMAVTPGLLWVGNEIDLRKCLPSHAGTTCADSCTSHDLFATVADALTASEYDDGNTPANSADDMLWLGSASNGLARFRLATESVAAQWGGGPGGPPSASVTSLALDRAARVLWVGTSDAGVGRLDITTGAWTAFGLAAGLPSLTVRDLALDAANVRLYVATPRGIGWLMTN